MGHNCRGRKVSSDVDKAEAAELSPPRYDQRRHTHTHMIDRTNFYCHSQDESDSRARQRVRTWIDLARVPLKESSTPYGLRRLAVPPWHIDVVIGGETKFLGL